MSTTFLWCVTAFAAFGVGAAFLGVWTALHTISAVLKLLGDYTNAGLAILDQAADQADQPPRAARTSAPPSGPTHRPPPAPSMSAEEFRKAQDMLAASLGIEPPEAAPVRRTPIEYPSESPED